MRKKRKKTKKKKNISNLKNIFLFLSVIVLLIAGISYAMYNLSDKNCIIMITDSRACHCVKQRCISFRGKISEILQTKFNNSVRFKVIEYSNKPRSEQIMNKYNMGLIPSIVIINKHDQAIYNSSFYNFNKEEFINKIYELKGKI